jgi:hypothetical protein
MMMKFYLIKNCVLYKTDYGKCSFNRIGGVLVSVLASSAVGPGFESIESNQKLLNWYVLLLRYARNIKEIEQRLGGSESG